MSPLGTSCVIALHQDCFIKKSAKLVMQQGNSETNARRNKLVSRPLWIGTLLSQPLCVSRRPQPCTLAISDKHASHINEFSHFQADQSKSGNSWSELSTMEASAVEHSIASAKNSAELLPSGCELSVRMLGRLSCPCHSSASRRLSASSAAARSCRESWNWRDSERTAASV
mmetsp:Transcript_14071/g.24735  ORF Transcript_14071/g.24735 Transcript_14071/m.24735 type:complete len:171 (-) Transcript_14071:1414-1926(-)